jgi:hypothetical protein
MQSRLNYKSTAIAIVKVFAVGRLNQFSRILSWPRCVDEVTLCIDRHCEESLQYLAGQKAARFLGAVVRHEVL